MRSLPVAVFLLSCSGQCAAMKLPARVSELLPQRALADPNAVAPLWRATRACYPTEDAAIEAVKLNKALLLPWVSSKESIEGSFRVLCETLGSRDEAVKVVTLNPGVLGCDPKRLSLSSADEIKSVAATAAALGSLRGPPLLVGAAALLACVLASIFGDASLAPPASAIVRPAAGAVGATAFFAAAAAAAYTSSRKP